MKSEEDAVDILVRGGVVVMPTDTTYGILGSAMDERVVNRIYALRKRDLDKPLIVLVADRSDLKKFGVLPTEPQNEILDKVWPKTVSSDEIVGPTDEDRFRSGPTSIILPCRSEKFAYLHRGKNTVAFRLPAKAALLQLLRATGPLVAPSANPQGHPVAKTIDEARGYFGHHVDFYQDGGEVVANPSRLIDITDGTEKILR